MEDGQLKIFLSWSGDRSQRLAQSLNEWLRLLFGDAVEPWMSQSEIEAGKRWSAAISSELSTCNFGILCLTPENVTAPWLLFEAGALAKSLDEARVIPVLFHLEFSEISSPLSDFQAKKCDKDGIRDVVLSINRAADKRDNEDRVSQLFELAWPRLCEKIDGIPENEADKQRRAPDAVMEELVSSVRALDSRFRSLEHIYIEAPPSRRRSRRIHPMMFEELLSFPPLDTEGSPLMLVMLAGLVGDDFPWLREVFIDAAHQLRSSDAKASEAIIERLIHMCHMSLRHPMMRELVSSRDASILSEELPVLLERWLARYSAMGSRSGGKEHSDASRPED